MFPKGPRFEPAKVSDVPGPNSYNLVQDSQLDNYKKGAFLEKTGRFLKEKESDVPGPGSYDLDSKPITSKPTTKQRVPSQNLSDRYAILQRKVEDLEKVHNDGKKAHQHEVERLKFDLARCQKSNSEQAERIEKQKKQTDLLESRIQELKKTSATEQTEIKDLRVKLRASETGELKTNLQSLEARRRDEVRERDQRIAELEKTLAGERKKKESFEARLLDLKGKRDEELQSARAAIQESKSLLNTVNVEKQQAQSVLETMEEQSTAKEEAFLARLEQHRCLLGLVAEEYGHLVSSSVSRTEHAHLKQQLVASQIQMLRLERKLANSEGQVVELANLIRQLKEDNTFLKQHLRETEVEIHLMQEALLEATSILPAKPNAALEQILHDISEELTSSQLELQKTYQRSSDLLAEFYRHRSEEALLAYSIINDELSEAEVAAQQHALDLSSALASHEAIAALLESVQKQRVAAEEQLGAAAETAKKLKASSESSARRVAEIEGELSEAARMHEESLKKERSMIKQLTAAVQTSRMAEDSMRAEIETLTRELTDAEQYQEAYYALSDEVGSLAARNQLAEDEAQRLSKFNAEILGHTNPAQRIMYVDRIRQELAEAKHKIVMLTREQENVAMENNELQKELEMYKSVMVPPEAKPRTTITRVGRPPLVNLARSVNTGGAAVHARSVSAGSVLQNGQKGSVNAEKTKYVEILETIPGDMTLDEIMY